MTYFYDDEEDNWLDFRQEDKENKLNELKALYGEDIEKDDEEWFDHPSLTAQERSPSLMGGR